MAVSTPTYRALRRAHKVLKNKTILETLHNPQDDDYSVALSYLAQLLQACSTALAQEESKRALRLKEIIDVMIKSLEQLQGNPDLLQVVEAQSRGFVELTNKLLKYGKNN